MPRPVGPPMPLPRNNNDLFGPPDGASEADTPAAIRQQGMTEQGITFSQDANATPPSGAFWGGQSDLSAGQYQEQTPAFYGPAPQQQAPDVVHFEDQQLPTLPDVPAHFDKTNPVHPTKLGMLLRVLAAAGVGGAAGLGERTVGGGFRAGVAANQQMAQNQAQRQVWQDAQQQRQNQIAMQQQQVAAYPGQQAALQAQQAQMGQLRQLQIDNLKQGPADKHIQSYIGDDGTQRVVFQKANGDTYERSFGGVQNTKTPPESKPPKVIVMGRNTYHWDTNTDKWTNIGPAPEHQGYGADGRRRTPQSTFNTIEKWKQGELLKIEKDSRYHSDNPADPSGKAQILTEEGRTMKQMVQDSYENMINAAGGDVEHFDYENAGTQNLPNGPSAAPPNPPSANVPPPGARIRDYTNLMPRVKRGR
jgi:hypothetical protein